MPRTNSPPVYRLHKARNSAVVTINGTNHYLGPYGSPESKEKYARLIAEHFRGGVASTSADHVETDLTVVEIAAAYLKQHVQTYHTKNGRPANRQRHIRLALGLLCDLYGRSRARDFGPKKLKVVREEMIRRKTNDRGAVSRGYVNDHVGIIKRLFRWSVAEELVPEAVYRALTTVESIHKGRDPRVKENAKVLPAPEEHISAVMEVVSPQIRAMIELQLMSGMRPDEVTIMRPCDIDRSEPVWTYKPESHKTDYLGFEKVVLLGPKSQEILKPWLNREPTAYLFDPREVVAPSYSRRRTTGKPKAKGVNRRRSRPLRPHYDDESYCQAVERACRRAGVPKWTPGQLRHNAGTKIRQKHGLEAARLILGHQNQTTTEVYAAQDLAKAADIMLQMG